MALVGFAVGLGGCLVTDKIKFEDAPEQAPRIVDHPGSALPIGSMFWVDKSVVVSGWTMEVDVIEENLTLPLEARWRLVGNTGPIDTFAPLTISPQGKRTRDFRFLVTTAAIVERQCYSLQLAISDHFDPNGDFDQVTSSDYADQVARASWWVLEGPYNKVNEATEADAMQVLTSCNPGSVDSDLSMPNANHEP